MNKQIEALRMAKQHIIERKGGRGGAVCYVKTDEDIIKAIDEAIAEAEKQEPTWIVNDTAGTKLRKYTNPATWQSLSEDEIYKCQHPEYPDIMYFARAIEQALKEKNT